MELYDRRLILSRPSGSLGMGRRIKENEDVTQAHELLLRITSILDQAGLSEIAVHTDYARQLLDQMMVLAQTTDF
jgi:hypothetical protein